jgi:hypothetical protein
MLMEGFDPMTKIGIKLAIEQLARLQGAKTPLAALEWALSRKILIPNPNVVMERGDDDLILTEYGRRVVGMFWLARERTRMLSGRGPVLRPNARPE